MNILYLTTGLSIGGAEKQVVLIANNMLKRGHSVTIISLTGDALVNPVDGVIVHNIGMKKKFFSFISTLLKVRGIIKKLNPDIVHSHMYHANIFSRILRFFVRFPVLICTAHNTNEGGRKRMLMYRMTDNLATLSTNVSEEAVKSFLVKKASFPNRIVCIHNGIDTEKLKFSFFERTKYKKKFNIPLDTPVILSVGRLTKAKDYPNLLDSYFYLIDKNRFDKEPILVIVGAGDLYDELDTYAKTLGIRDKVMFLGARNDVENLINIADVFVLSSEWEGFGLVVAEAMACERLVVATDSGGVKEVIGECGTVVPIKNHELLADGIIAALELPEAVKHRLGQCSRNRIISLFSIEIIVNKWLDLYEKLIEVKYITISK
ncbi:glycosyltransferase [Yersinia pseudotuberculosis]|uniref:Putative glycosyl transferase n=1 Tax=Yersinia pseudotuberculosis TaxID=633 RepID=F1CLM2_YERPU|nr:glycosyltransferase [Yersinia pseudotuberculosis]ADX97405.1 putative glycosyl transferase [Yersinia pseudotuberculosis]CFV22449.1 WbcN protein [Yersinia pseudotuberculosis]